MSSRRLMLQAAAASVATASAAAASAATPRGAKTLSEHYINGGLGGIQRARYTYTPTSTDSGYGIIPITAPVYTYMLPITVEQFDESQGGRFQMQGDGMVTIMQTGFYNLTANLDWPGSHGQDVNLRELGIQRVKIGQPAPVYKPGKLTLLPYYGESYDFLAVNETTGGDTMPLARAAVTWDPGTIAAGGMAFVDVPLTAYFPLVPGDVVQVGHTSLTDALLGTKNAGLLISARVVNPNKIRVWIENRYNTSAVTIPSGTLNVAAQSATILGGSNSADAWTFLNSCTVYLYAGEKIFIAVKSNTPGDYIQISSLSFMQISSVA